MNWVTNDPEAAKKLRKADRAYEQAKSAASSLPLEEKINAIRAAREAKQTAYQAVVS